MFPFLFSSGGDSVSVSTITEIMNSVTNQFSIANIVAFIAGIIAICIPFVFLWWGARKAYSSIIGATQGGSMSGLMSGRRRRR